jgi:hypothetical protein
MFPAGSAGIALLVLRFIVAAMLAMIAFPRGEATAPTWEIIGLSLLAFMLCMGAFTPVSCTLCGTVELVDLYSLRGADAVHMIFSVLVTICLAMLGPGAFSLDSKMFGRRVILPPAQ